MTHETESTVLHLKFDHAFAKRFKKFSFITGILLMIVGLAGAILPQLMSLVITAFTGWLLVTGGFLTAYLAFLGRGKSMIAFLKPILLILTGSIFIYDPLAGLAVIALMLTFYLLMDAFGGFGLAYDMYPMHGWGWMAVNGLMSFILAMILFIGWPLTSPLLVGLFVGVSLFFDGIALVVIGLVADKTQI